MNKENVAKKKVENLTSTDANMPDLFSLQKERSRAVRDAALAVSYHCAACILDESGRIITFTDKFQAIMDQKFISQIDLERRKPKLTLSQTDDQKRFIALLQPILDREQSAADAIFINERWAWRVVIQDLDPIPANSASKIRLIRQFMVRFVNLKMKIPVRQHLPMLNHVFGLTPAEQNLSAELLETKSLPDAATRLGIKVSTARTQLKSIFEKVGVHSQSALIARLTAMIMCFECTSLE